MKQKRTSVNLLGRVSGPELDPQAWRERQFGWTAPVAHNAFASIGSTLAFCAALMAIALWRLRRMDF